MLLIVFLTCPALTSHNSNQSPEIINFRPSPFNTGDYNKSDTSTSEINRNFAIDLNRCQRRLNVAMSGSLFLETDDWILFRWQADRGKTLDGTKPADLALWHQFFISTICWECGREMQCTAHIILPSGTVTGCSWCDLEQPSGCSKGLSTRDITPQQAKV